MCIAGNMPDWHYSDKTISEICHEEYAYYAIARRMPRGHNAGAMQNLEKIREAKGMTQKDLALRAGINQATLSKIERGKGNPTLHMITKIADALGCHAADLFDLPEIQRRAIDAIQSISDPAKQEAALVVVESMGRRQKSEDQ